MRSFSLPNNHNKVNEKIPRMIVIVIVTQHHTNGYVFTVITLTTSQHHTYWVFCGWFWMVLAGFVVWFWLVLWMVLAGFVCGFGWFCGWFWLVLCVVLGGFCWFCLFHVLVTMNCEYVRLVFSKTV